ncbi:MAG: TIGR03618 family F420-dependent PPOX class oxidoreductase [Chloroflexota bacterium]|nr:MAG: TIGR03618 family F420-dependent PPOX class oxidoreductase [Chloroflexota bacterium]
MRRNLTPDDIKDLLDARRCSTLATYRKDGGVLLSPVWHEWVDGAFQVHVGADDIKGRHLQRDKRVSLVLYDDTPPYRGIEVRGRARFLAEGEREAIRRIAVRYLGPVEGGAYADKVDWAGILIRIEAENTRIWDFADEYATR